MFFAAATVIFREILEIALILSVVLAATRGLPGRGRFIWSGIGAGLAGAAIIAAFTESLNQLADGSGQEIMNAAILLLAAAMIAWTVIWMKTHGREIAQKIKALGQGVQRGDVPVFSLALVIALAVFREGAEITLFSYALLASGQDVLPFIGGAACGALAGGIVGLLMYVGLLRISPAHFFNVTSILLTLLAAGMAAKGINYLAIAGILPELIYPVWDTSPLLPENSVLGETLSVLIGYSDRPSGIQLLAYVATLAFITFGLRTVSRRTEPASASA